MVHNKQLSQNKLMLMLTLFVVLLSVVIHVLHRYFNVLETYRSLQGIATVTGGLLVLLNFIFIIPIILFAISVALYYKNKYHSTLPVLLTLTLTASSVSIIAGGNGLVEYHFSIFMVLAIIASFQRISLVIYSTIIFAIHHFAGYFFFPQLLCGTEDYRFSLLMIHAIFLVATAAATIVIIRNGKAREALLAKETQIAEQQLTEVIHEMEAEGAQLKELSIVLTGGSSQAASASLNISNALQGLKATTDEEAAAMNQAITQNNENIQRFHAIHEKTERVAIQAKNSLTRAASGKDSIHAITVQMGTITTTIQSINELVDTLADQSSEITKLLNVIHNISEQTQLLALNASIEAARAGEHGKGFSVVASEIRNLATGTQASAKEINEVMDSIQHQIATVAKKMDLGMNEIYQGNESIQTTEATFDSIVSTISDVEQHILSIAESTDYLISQTVQSMELFNNVAHTNNLTVNNIAVISNSSVDQYHSVESLNEAITTLNKIADGMYSLIEKIK
ncbi:methyl-accepting chemotaxis protein [Lysinibacillus sp. 54212]|uniref:methyl-accepting chemotaxis protein n=1 Tax=Lysinibacillus sp. 54212 TaxID=3119829 RepID=UPI002FCC49FD